MSGLALYYNTLQWASTIDGEAKLRSTCKLVIWGKLIEMDMDILELTHRNVRLIEVGQTYMAQIMARDHQLFFYHFIYF